MENKELVPIGNTILGRIGIDRVVIGNMSIIHIDEDKLRDADNATYHPTSPYNERRTTKKGQEYYSIRIYDNYYFGTFFPGF